MSVRRLVVIGATVAAVTGAGLYLENHDACGCALPKPEPAKWPVLTRSPVVGHTLNTTNGVWVRSGAHARDLETGFAVQWKVCTSVSDLGGCSNAPGTGNHCANSSDGCPYTVAAPDIGDYLRSFVTATGAGGSTTQYSLPSGEITSGVVPVNTLPPDISGIPMPAASGIPGAGGLWVTTGAWKNSPTSYSYQWQDCDATGANCTNATGAGATSREYTVAPADKAGTIRVAVTAYNSSGDSTPADAYTGPAPALWDMDEPTGTALRDANLARLIIGNQPSKSYVDAVHANSSTTKVIRYVSAIGAYDGQGGGQPCVDSTLGWAQASAHPGNPQYDWFLYKSSGFGSGNRIVEPTGPTNALYWMDIGNSYEQACADTYALNTTRSIDAAGNFVDEVTLAPSAQSFWPAYPISSATGGYASDAAFDNAYLSELTAWTSAMHAVGQIVIPNLGGSDRVSNSVWEEMVNATDGQMEEGFPVRALPDEFWAHKIAEGSYAEAHGKWFIGVPGGEGYTAENDYTYSLASFLLFANGHSVLDIAPLTGNSINAWYAALNTAMELGPATGAYFTRSIGGVTIYERDFANGVDLVNPSQSSATFAPEAAGGTYSGRECDTSCSTLTNARSITMGADAGAVLLRTG